MGRNLLIAHGGGPTSVMNAALYGVIRECEAQSDVAEVLGARHGIEGVLAEEFVDLGRQPAAVIDALPGRPSSALGSCRRKLSDTDYEQIASVLESYDIGCFIYQGGNDSMDTAMKLSRMPEAERVGLRVVGLPKTVDNDLPETDHCPGYGSAARFYAQVARDMDVDNQALPSPIAVLEVMGRNTGWLAAACSLGKDTPEQGPHLIYVPERPFDDASFLADVRDVYNRHRRALVVVSEGLVRNNGIPVYISDRAVDCDDFGHRLPGNVGKYLADLLGDEAGLRARNLKPDLWGRSCAMLQSATDRDESIALGRHAVQMVVAGWSGIMLNLVRTSQEPYEFDIGAVALEKVANVERPMNS
jgi:6-phosphofructokinase